MRRWAPLRVIVIGSSSISFASIHGQYYQNVLNRKTYSRPFFWQLTLSVYVIVGLRYANPTYGRYGHLTWSGKYTTIRE